MFDKMLLSSGFKTLTEKIAHHAHQGEASYSLWSFIRPFRTGEKANRYVLLALLKACGRLQALQQGKNAHGMILKRGFQADVTLMTSVLCMYSNCTLLEESHTVFLEMERKDTVMINAMIVAFFRCHKPSDAVCLFHDSSLKDVGTWNSVISGLVQASKDYEALGFFKHMVLEGEKTDFITLVSVLSACANLAASCNARQTHAIVIKRGHDESLPVGNAMIDMYAKVGEMDDAYACFKNMPLRNVITWTSLIVGYGKHGLGMEALRSFELMKMAGFVPNNVTFVGTLSACSHAGLVYEGWRSYRAMVDTYGITPEMTHYGCVVDLLARAGRLKEAWKFIMTMPEPDAELWTSFLSSCFYHRNEQLSRFAGERLLELRPSDGGAYVLLSNVYSQAGDLAGVAKVRRWMMSRGIVKKKAQTWIEINGKIHSFESGDRSHPSYREIVKYLENILERIKAIGYVPNLDVVIQGAVDEETKEEIILGHSEKLAIAFGLVRTKPGTRIMIIKNLRVCQDCHSAIKFISIIERREIIARDSSRFHKFKDGECSCRDHW